ncbi:glycosyltransferase [Actinomycetospora chibensis]|uniref:Glycosyltransferase n=1 Tax=Actinomycetospora chibensis TaxID=663606 RepID=A0ABV9RIL2_9PSEU|nr:glycosyltransferase [Actinomycetospora chibensis]MDD7922503.1 glycosyltransferase [Actinomycetospora chibensis]
MTDVHAVRSATTTSRAARAVVARGLFAGPTSDTPDELYAEIVRGRAERRRHHVRVGEYSHISTNTYFGRFFASYWQRWATATEVRFEGRIRGHGRVSLRASDTNGVPRTLAVHDVGTGDLSLSATLDRFLDGGGLWIEIQTDDEELLLSESRWTVAAPTTDRRTSLVVCTHNRPVDCVTTLRAILDDTTALETLDRIVVVDQGTDRVEDQPRFAEVAGDLGARLTYLTQGNLGGAGGFTRGLYELVELGSDPHTDVLLMDDDVRCEPEVVVRLSAFARHTAVPTIVGAQMLNLLHPTQVIAGAERADFVDLACGRRPEGAIGESDVTGYFPDGTKNVQDRRVDADYTGWWACLIPAEVTRAIGYPLPLFFQWDDVEYGYRARAHGFPTVTLPGAGLWHADFMWKDWDDWRRYFNHRNAMITAAMHSEFPVRAIGRTIRDHLFRYVLAMNYGLAATLIKAVDDFLEGPGVLADGGVSAAFAIQEERRRYTETTLHSVHDVPGLPGVEMPIARAGFEPSRPGLVRAKRVVQQATGRLPHHGGLIGAGEAHWWHVSLFDRVGVVDAGQNGVRLRRRDPAHLKHLSRESARVLWRFAREGSAAAERWRAAQGSLTAPASWRRLFGLDEA